MIRATLALGIAVILVGPTAAFGVPTQDAGFVRQWALAAIEPKALAADPSVVVAVLDTGISAHPNLGWRLNENGRGIPGGATLPGYDFISDPWNAADGNGWDPDPSDRGDGVRPAEALERSNCRARISSWHGTNVAGTIASRPTRSNPVIGIASGARILPVRTLGRCGGNTADVAAAILWSAGHPVAGVRQNPYPARIINLSLSGISATCPRTLQTAIDIAESLGSIVVTASGSTGRNTSNQTPANCANVVVVGAVDREDRRSPTSNYGQEVTLSAPGGNMAVREVDGIFSTTNSGRYRPRIATSGYYQGSSAAAAYVSGVFALMISRQPNLTTQDIRATATRSDVLQPFRSGQCDVGEGLCGGGILKAENVLKAFPSR